MRIGVIYCAYQTEDLIEASLRPWIEARQSRLAGHDYVICAISVPFTAFDQIGLPPDRTRAILGTHAHAGAIDHAIVSDHATAETEARGRALRWLVDKGCEVTIMVDSDEIYLFAEIERIFALVAARPHVACWKGSLRNYVFDDKTYLTEPFTPMRIHRVNLSGGYRAAGFWDDNNVYYQTANPINGNDGTRDIELPCSAIPKSICWAKHLSWINDGRSKAKVAYQWRRWGRCSFDWDDSQGGLIWRAGQPVPETARDA